MSVLHLLKDQVEELIRRIAEEFMEIAYVKDIKNAYDTDPTDNSHYVPLKNVYLGMTSTTTINEMEGARPTDVTTFYTDCRNFFIEMIMQIKERFDVTSEINTVIQCLNPKNTAVLNTPSISRIIESTFPTANLNKNLLELEWRGHIYEKEINKDMDWEDYWQKIMAMKETTGSKKYATLTKVVALVAGLPVSNAPVEQIFSSLKLIKTGRRSSLTLSSLVSLMQARYFLKQNGVAAVEYTPGATEYNLFKRMKANATDEEA